MMTTNECLPEIDAFVMAELPTTHISMITNDLPHMLRWHVFLHRINEAKFPLLRIAL